jgi:hypothetical protein
VAGKKQKPELGWKILSGLSAVVAGMAVRKAMEQVWVRATGNKPPENPESPEVQLREALLWAVATGVTIGVARLLATRGVAKAWHRATGELPAAFRDAEDSLD